MDNLTRDQRHHIMSHIRGYNTKPEIILRKTLWKRGVRYRTNYDKLPGKPDIVITRCKIAIFVDGDFWHGKNIDSINKRIQTHREYWIPKLQRNKQRDAEINDLLTEQGWLVLRFWESDIKKNLDKCLDTVLSYIPDRK